MKHFHKAKHLIANHFYNKLFDKAVGYSHPDVDIRVIDGVIVKTELVKH